MPKSKIGTEEQRYDHRQKQRQSDRGQIFDFVCVYWYEILSYSKQQSLKQQIAHAVAKQAPRGTTEAWIR